MLALVALAASAWSAGAAPLEAYGKLPNIEQAVISPGGVYVAYVVTNGEKRTIAIQSADDHKILMTSGAGTQKVRDISWAGDDHLIVTVSTTKQAMFVTGPRVENYLAQDLDLKRGRPRPLLNHVDGTAAPDALNTVLGPPIVRTIGGKPVVFLRGVDFPGGNGVVALFRTELDGGGTRIVEQAGRGGYDWVIDASGRAVAHASYDDKAGVWTVMLRGPSGLWRAAQSVVAPLDNPDLHGFGKDATSVLIDVTDAKGGYGWRELSLATGAWGAFTPAREEEAPIYDPATDRLIGRTFVAGDVRTYDFFDAHDAAVWRMVAKAFAGDPVSLNSWSDDRKRIVVRVDSAELGPAYALVNLNTGRADWLSEEYSDLKPEDISPVRSVRYRAADGLEIAGYLTLPRSRDPHGLPLVVLAHGGPAARDEPGFDWWAQALASRGYAVLQANFRGSTGYGGDFMAAGFGQWGRKMQTDLSDGVRDLAHQGIVDPKRVCIVGASYGGYAALAGATIDHGVYRCAVSVGGVADLRNLVSDFRTKQGLEAQRYWFRFIGSQNAHDPVMATYSPITRAAEADIPILLIHGHDDTVVPVGQSRDMAEALRRAGKPVEFLELKGEDHWLSTGETRLQMLQATVAFLEKNNPPN
jgi:dipeptidyl aminopeptidase/acylaminoacyl peptidase